MELMVLEYLLDINLMLTFSQVNIKG